MPNVSIAELLRFTREILLAAGVPPEAAGLTAESLVAANTCGVESHGVQLLPLYIDQLAAGDVDPNAEGQITGEFGSCVLFDGENGLGQVVAARCCAEAVNLAHRFGIGLVVARNSNHFGRAAYWGARISSENCLGMVFSNSSPLVAPWQAREARLGTNPICVAAPGPWLLDMATTSAAAGRIVDAVLDGESSIPEEWALDSAGYPTTSPSAALKGTVLPLGGRVAGHKGSGLAVAVEILCGVLSGGPIGKEVGSLRSRGRPAGVSQTFLAIDIRKFFAAGEFEERIGRLVGMIKSTPTAPGFDEVLVAGEKEARCAAVRMREGTPIPNRLWKTLNHLGGKYKVEALQLSSVTAAMQT